MSLSLVNVLSLWTLISVGLSAAFHHGRWWDYTESLYADKFTTYKGNEMKKCTCHCGPSDDFDYKIHPKIKYKIKYVPIVMKAKDPPLVYHPFKKSGLHDDHQNDWAITDLVHHDDHYEEDHILHQDEDDLDEHNL